MVNDINMRKKLLFMYLLLLPMMIHAGNVPGTWSGNTLTIGGDATNSDNDVPYFNCFKYSTNQFLYTPQEIGKSGIISSIAFKVANSRPHVTSEVKIYLGHKSDLFSDENDYVTSNHLTLVYSGSPTLGQTTGWETMIFNQEMFAYNGTDNLVVVVTHRSNQFTSALTYSCYPGDGYTLCRWDFDSPSYGDVTNTNNAYSLSTNRPSVQLVFGSTEINSGFIHTIGGITTSSDNDVPYAVNYKYSTAQMLYTPSEIGWSGTISSIAFKVANSTPLATSEVKIYLGHKSDTLSGEKGYASCNNLTLVYSGSPTLGQATGWETLNFNQGTFTYNGTDNLVVVVTRKGNDYTNGPKFFYNNMGSGYALLRWSDEYVAYGDVTNTYYYSVSSKRPAIQLTFGVLPTSISLNYTNVGLQVGGTRQLSATVSPSNASPNITWSVISGCDVASVNSSGLVTANALGTAIIRAASTINNSVYRDCKVTVSEKVLNDGETFVANTVEGVEMTFKVISAMDMTCQVGSGTNSSSQAISPNTQGSITIPEEIRGYVVTTIGNYAFYGCNALTAITIPSTLKRVKTGSFYGCTSLAKVIVTDIAAWCGIIYDGNDGLGDFPLYYARYLYSDENTEITEVVIPEGVTRIEARAFRDAKSITSLTIPSSVTYIGEEAFEGMNSLNSINIPQGVTSIEPLTFCGCKVLSTVAIPESVTCIGDRAFAKCSGLKDFYCYAFNVPDTGNNLFTNSPIGTARLHVPGRSIEAYRATEPWSSFGEILPITHILTYVVDDEVYKTYEIEYGESITPEPEPTKKCYTFSGWSEIPETMPAHDVTVIGTFTVIDISCADYVDLGLPSGTIWATCNIGAESPEDFGNYYDWEDNPVQEYWDDIWRTPSKAERDELVTYCTYSLDIVNGIQGAKYTGSNGHSIFFPFAGYIQSGSGPFNVGGGGQYWTTTEHGDDGEHWVLATNYETQHDNDGHFWPLYYFSFPVRAVCNRTDIITQTFKLTYFVDGEEYKSYYIVYGTKITPEPAPEKEGYTFSGWSEIPETMPAHDVTVTGTFSAKYKMGDVNGDREVDLSDAIMVTYYSLHVEPANFNKVVADMNGDGEIDLSDAIIIIYKSLGVK